jgi:hypothetical protein
MLWWSCTAAAIDRLQDESQLVVKAAVQLLYKMVQQSIFQPPLKLQVRECPHDIGPRHNLFNANDQYGNCADLHD